jgi:hypothetical protein
VSIRSLNARLERLQARAGAHYVIGQDRDRDRKRREQLFRLKLNSGLTDVQTAELAGLDASFEREFRPKWEELAAHLRAIAGNSAADGAHNKFESERERAPAEAEECVTSEANRAAATGRPAPNAAEKLKPASPDLMTDAELLEQLLLAANHNVVPGEGIEDVGPVKVMLESGITLDDVLYTLKGKVDRRAYPGNTALASWSEQWFVRAVAEEYGRRVMVPVIKEKLKARWKTA